MFNEFEYDFNYVELMNQRFCHTMGTKGGTTIMTFGEILKRRRLENGLTQQQLAEKVFSTTTAISQFEHDKHLPKTDMIYSLAEVLNTPVEVLLFAGADIVRDLNLSEEFLKSDETKKTFGYIPDKLSITDVAEHKYRNLKIWNPEYTLEKFMVDIVYPYIQNNPEEMNNLVKLYGEKPDNTVENEDVSSQTETSELILSKTVRKDISKSKNNTMVFSMPRTGKDRHILIPNILNLNTNMVITDANGNLYESTHKELEKKGYNVKILNVTMDKKFEDDENLIGYNPFLYLNDERSISVFVEKFLEPYKQYDISKEQIYIAKERFKSCIAKMLKEYNKEEWSIQTLMCIVDDLARTEDLNQMGNIYNYIISTLFSLNNEVITEHLSDDFNIDEFIKNKKWAIFIYIDTWHHSANLMNHAIIDHIITRRLHENMKNKTVFIFDEIENIGKIDGLAEMMAANKEDVFLCVSTSLESLVALYGKDTTDMLINECNNIVCFRAHSIGTCEYISKLGGIVRLDKPKRIFPTGKRYEVPVFDTREIANLKDGECIVLCQGAKAIVDKAYDIIDEM